jgi:regulator of sigma D
MAAFPALEHLRQQYVAYLDVQTQEACNKDDNYHYADDVENIHCVLRSRYARFQYESAGA